MPRRTASSLVVPVLLCVGQALSANAATINYGDFVGNTVTYQNVTEDSITDPVPLYGAPTIAADSLVFSPPSFGSFSTGAGGSDITDGTLTTMVTAHPGSGIGQIVLHETGDVTLVGSGGAGTSATVAATVFAQIFEIDGVGVTPFTIGANATFSPSNGDFDLLNDGAMTGLIWLGDLTLDVGAGVASHGYSGVATRLNLSIDNVLTTASETGTSATIKKKAFDGTSVTIVPPAAVPEPASLALVGTSLIGLVAWVRRRVQ